VNVDRDADAGYDPAALAEVRRRVAEGREFQEAVREVLAANAQLLVLARRQEKEPKKKKR